MNSSEHCLSVSCFEHPVHCPCGISNHIVSYPITKGHTQRHLLTPGRKYSTATEEAEGQNTALFKVCLWEGEVHMSVHELLSLASRQELRKEQSRVGTWHAGLETLCFYRKAGCPLVVPPSQLRVRVLWKLKVAASHQEFRIHTQFLPIPQF